jgi:hypothetical protein
MESISTPRVTVAMAVYNVGPFVREAVDSVLSQSFCDFEILAACARCRIGLSVRYGPLPPLRP